MVSNGISAFVIVCDVVPGIIQNVNNDASTGKIFFDGAVDTALSAGTIYFSGKIGATVGTYCGGFVGAVAGYGAGLVCGWLIDHIR